MGVPAFYESITDFIFVKDEPEKADVIFVPGGHTGVHARTAARLYREGFAPLVLPSGRFSKEIGHYVGPGEGTYETECEYLKNVLMEEGVPGEAILCEDRAVFTWENAICSRQLLADMKIGVRTAILCCQAHHARRALMYYQSQFTDVRILTVPTVSNGIGPDDWYLDKKKTEAVLGEVARIGRQFGCMLPLGDPLGYAQAQQTV